jgi:hypothetical protein
MAADSFQASGNGMKTSMVISIIARVPTHASSVSSLASCARDTALPRRSGGIDQARQLSCHCFRAVY